MSDDTLLGVGIKKITAACRTFFANRAAIAPLASSRGSRKRPQLRFSPFLEELEARVVLSVTGTLVSPSSGSFPAQATQVFSGTIFYISDSDPSANAASFAACISWGDGTYGGVNSTANFDGQIVWNGGSSYKVVARHTYAEPWQA